MNKIDEALASDAERLWREEVRKHRAVFADITRERQRQDAKWGPQHHNPLEWLGILAEEFGEAAKDSVDVNWHTTPAVRRNLREELVQTAAVAVAWIEDWDERELW